MHPDLRRIDLNLLLVFDAVYRSRSVTVAAEELSMSPSACSHALSRLRQSLSDELFVRYGSAMQPTVQAEELAGAVGEALRLLTSGLSTSAPFIPSTSQQVFTFAASDVTALAVLPGLVARLEAQAPHLQLRVHSTLYRDSMDDLASGRAQFVLGFSDEYSGPYEGVEVLEGATEDYVVVGCSAHAGPDSALSLEHYLSARHVVVMPWTDAGSVIDVALAQQSLKRNVALQVHSMAVAPLLVAGSKLLLTIPRPVAAQLCRDERFVTYEMPFSSPRYTIKVLFHARYASSPGHRWIREQIRVLLSGLDGF